MAENNIACLVCFIYVHFLPLSLALSFCFHMMKRNACLWLSICRRLVCVVRLECLDVPDCKQRYKINYCLCSSSHCLQDGDTDASCESQGIEFQVHVATDKWWHIYIYCLRNWLKMRADRNLLKIRADSKLLATISSLFFARFSACFCWYV